LLSRIRPPQALVADDQVNHVAILLGLRNGVVDLGLSPQLVDRVALRIGALLIASGGNLEINARRGLDVEPIGVLNIRLTLPDKRSLAVSGDEIEMLAHGLEQLSDLIQ
jgi:hypothetical protein